MVPALLLSCKICLRRRRRWLNLPFFGCLKDSQQIVSLAQHLSSNTISHVFPWWVLRGSFLRESFNLITLDALKCAKRNLGASRRDPNAPRVWLRFIFLLMLNWDVILCATWTVELKCEARYLLWQCQCQLKSKWVLNELSADLACQRWQLSDSCDTFICVSSNQAWLRLLRTNFNLNLVVGAWYNYISFSICIEHVLYACLASLSRLKR